MSLYLFYFLPRQSGFMLFPPGGFKPFLPNPLTWAWHLALPWATLAMTTAAVYLRISRRCSLRRYKLSAEGEDEMLMKSIAAGLAGTALLATVAFAQNPTATTDKAAPAATTTTTTTTTASGERRASTSGLKIYNDANETLARSTTC